MPVATASRSKSIEDFPFNVGGDIVQLSQRAKEVLEAEAPGQCEYIEQYVGPPPHEDHGPIAGCIDYKMYVLNILNLVDCIDREKSDWRGPNGTYVNIVMDVSKVPDHLKIFRVLDHEFAVYIRDPLYRAMKFAKLTGFTVVPAG